MIMETFTPTRSDIEDSIEANARSVMKCMSTGLRLLVEPDGRATMVGKNRPFLFIWPQAVDLLLSRHHICEWHREDYGEVIGWENVNAHDKRFHAQGIQTKTPSGGWPGHRGRLYRCMQ